jgi:hypothetical protein
MPVPHGAAPVLQPHRRNGDSAGRNARDSLVPLVRSWLGSTRVGSIH